MPTYLASWAIWRDLIPVPLFALFVAVVVAGALAKGRGQFPSFVAIIFSISMLGLVTGMMTGQSREPAVGAVVPAALSLMSGVVVYLTGIKRVRTQVLIAAVVATFSINLLVGTFWGARLRLDFDNYL
jgi:hypothetical protein